MYWILAAAQVLLLWMFGGLPSAVIGATYSLIIYYIAVYVSKHSK